LNFFVFPVSISGVRHFRSVFFALAAFLWLPVSTHCQLESFPGLEFLRCAVDTQAAGGGTDCGDSGCCAVEKAQYQSSHVRVTIPSPELLPLLPVELTDITDILSDECSTVAFTVEPPELPEQWQFVFRTASPPRAPSFVS
jgi:hypothetical protein